MGDLTARSQKCASPPANASSHGAVWHQHPCTPPVPFSAACQRVGRARMSRRGPGDRILQRHRGTAGAVHRAPRAKSPAYTPRRRCARSADAVGVRAKCVTGAKGTRSSYLACAHLDDTPKDTTHLSLRNLVRPLSGCPRLPAVRERAHELGESTRMGTTAAAIPAALVPAARDGLQLCMYLAMYRHITLVSSCPASPPTAV